MAKFFDFIIQGYEATEENAYSAARGLDWQEIEIHEANYPNLQYVGTLNGVGIWYNYGSDDYYFTDEDSEDDYEPEEKLQDPIQQIDALGDLGSFGLNEDVRNLISEALNEIGPEMEVEDETHPWKKKRVPDSKFDMKSRVSKRDFKMFSYDSSNMMNVNESKKIVQITTSQFQQIIKEGVAKLHKQTLIENRIQKINEELGILNESDTYFDSLSQALDAVRNKAAKLGYEVDEETMFSNFGTGGISYETTKRANIELLKDGEPILGRSGKPLNRAIAVSIYRMPSGKYELTAYQTW